MHMQAEFRPSDLLCSETLCWVPHERVQPAVLASGAYTDLSAVPGALAGLGAGHGVASDGRPDASATQVVTCIYPHDLQDNVFSLLVCNLPPTTSCSLVHPQSAKFQTLLYNFCPLA